MQSHVDLECPLTAEFQGNLGPLACELHGMRGQPFFRTLNCDPGLGHMPVASAGTGQEQGEFAWLHIQP